LASVDFFGWEGAPRAKDPLKRETTSSAVKKFAGMGEVSLRLVRSQGVVCRAKDANAV
jgi:hypothetical protein